MFNMDNIQKASKFIEKFFPDKYPYRRKHATGCQGLTTYSIKHFIEDFYKWQGDSIYIRQDECEYALKINGILVDPTTHRTNINFKWLNALRDIFPRI